MKKCSCGLIVTPSATNHQGAMCWPAVYLLLFGCVSCGSTVGVVIWEAADDDETELAAE